MKSDVFGPYSNPILKFGNRFTTIRIFDLSSVQVRIFTEQDKQGGVTSEFLRWDLRNESDIPVASGIYIVHIDMPELGKVKVLKTFIIQSQEMLKYY